MFLRKDSEEGPEVWPLGEAAIVLRNAGACEGSKPDEVAPAKLTALWNAASSVFPPDVSGEHMRDTDGRGYYLSLIQKDRSGKIRASPARLRALPIACAVQRARALPEFFM